MFFAGAMAGTLVADMYSFCSTTAWILPFTACSRVIDQNCLMNFYFKKIKYVYTFVIEFEFTSLFNKFMFVHFCDVFSIIQE